jgi:hypothetical protein
MTPRTFAPLSLVLALTVSCGGGPSQSVPSGEQIRDRGTIRGHVRLVGTPPENPVIRMRADPMCETLNQGQRVVAATVVAGPDGGLANAFVHLQGSFPAASKPAEPVLLDQRACIYTPRVVGMQLGQVLRVRNSDPGLHNVHGLSTTIDEFNISQPTANLVNEIRPRQEGILKLQCDVHAWMVAFVGVVSHPYFAVTNTNGAFEIDDVPAGTHTIEVWHERYGTLTSSVTVDVNGVADVDFAYAAS